MLRLLKKKGKQFFRQIMQLSETGHMGLFSGKVNPDIDEQ